MDIQALTAFDIGVLVIIGLSLVMAFSRGFTTVALSFAAWAGALFVTVFGFALTSDFAKQYIQPDELADLITLVVLFFLSLFILKQLAEFIGNMIKSGPLGFLDRSLGALFGLLRGIVVVSIMYLAFSKFYPGTDQPAWMSNSQTKPLIAWSANMVEGFVDDILGKDTKQTGSEYLQKVKDSVPSSYLNEKLEKEAAKYKEQARKSMEELVEEATKEAEKKKKDQ
ncbi:CvpA family protein [Temperatibacter marinus]|uniref:CvpA family protein n=1 Tax=Temperatibacter marinus TaxID=1456591 RepID=A0AA52ECE1_9PROT|nr:CvpA family protein [Temperatibacter marinus]WND02130.1 CvpA family protein [Temperatibacter marinus]